MTVVSVVIALLVLAALGLVISYNRFVRQRNVIQESWQQIDVELRRRYDLIPNLVQTVKGYAAHERDVLQNVVAARASASAPSESIAAQAADESALNRSLRQLFAVAENYPNLKADQQFLALQSQLGETEDRIAAGRRFYNGNVRAYNTRVETFPSSLVASVMSFEKAEYFEVDEPEARAPVQVDFGERA
ncbi:MAG: LemA family protein [Mycobacteriales bacterium]|nr:LemA family protein [Frankia sp.]